MKRLSALFMGVVLVLSGTAATITITASTNWSAAGIASGDVVIVKNNATLTVDVEGATCADMQLGSNVNPNRGHGTLAFSNSSASLSITGTLTLGDASKNAYFDFTNGGYLTLASVTGSGYGTCTCDDGTFEFTTTQTLAAGTFAEVHDLVISGGTLTLGRNMIVNGNVTIEGGATLNANSMDITIYGNWDNNGGTYTPGSGIIKFNSGGSQTINETATLYKLNVESGTTLVAETDIHVTTLKLSNGKLNIGTYDLYIPASGDITSESSVDFVIADGGGSVFKTYDASHKSFVFPVGDSDENYSPVTIRFTSASTYGTVEINVTDGDHPALATSGNSYISRWWEISGTDFTSFTYNFDAVYVDADVVGTESNIYGSLYSGGVWYSGKIAENDAANTLSRDANSSFSNIGGGDGGALPVKLLRFNAEPDAKQVKLSWATSLEVNNDHFIVERTSDGENFELIGKVQGSGNSTSVKEYGTIDYNPIPGMAYYRLKQIDTDGKYEYFPMVAVTTSVSSAGDCVITVFPNPCMQTCTINLENCPHESAGDIQLELFDLAGNKVKSNLPRKSSDGNNASFHMDTENAMAPGVFIIRASNAGKSSSGKVVVG